MPPKKQLSAIGGYYPTKRTPQKCRQGITASRLIFKTLFLAIMAGFYAEQGIIKSPL